MRREDTYDALSQRSFLGVKERRKHLPRIHHDRHCQHCTELRDTEVGRMSAGVMRSHGLRFHSACARTQCSNNDIDVPENWKCHCREDGPRKELLTVSSNRSPIHISNRFRTAEERRNRQPNEQKKDPRDTHCNLIDARHTSNPLKATTIASPSSREQIIHGHIIRPIRRIRRVRSASSHMG